MALVDVLIPVRNAAPTLEESLASLAAQTFERFRALVVDDGSTDSTPELLTRAAMRDPRLVVERIESSGNIARALAHAAARATAPLVARFDLDDVARPERFARQVEYLDRHPDVGLVATGVERIGPPATAGALRYDAWLASCVTPEEIAANLWIESPLPHPTVMMRREVYEAAGGYRDLDWPEDYDLWLRMLRLGVRMAKIPEVLLAWRDAPSRASRTQGVYAPDRFLACRAHHLARFLEGRPVIVWGAGRDGRRTARALLAEGAAVEAFLDIDPRKIGRRAYGREIHDAEAWLGAVEGGRALILAAVGTAGARELIRARLVSAGLVEGVDFLSVA